MLPARSQVYVELQLTSVQTLLFSVLRITYFCNFLEWYSENITL